MRYACALLLSVAPALFGQPAAFPWPEGKRAAISLTFDDARPSQIDNLMPLLDKDGVKATFYVLPRAIPDRLAGWKQAVARGHEIGSHSTSHPCTVNYEFSLRNALEDYTLDRMERDLDEASKAVDRLLGVKPRTFAYPCGQKFVGRGLDVRSYVPLIALRFLAGRGYRDESPNDPRLCDRSQLMGIGMDELDAKELLRLAAAAAGQGRWLILVGHDVGPTPAYQTTNTAALEALSRYARDPANGIWIDTVAAVAMHVMNTRGR